jgi:hypothetical protein
VRASRAIAAAGPVSGPVDALVRPENLSVTPSEAGDGIVTARTPVLIAAHEN